MNRTVVTDGDIFQLDSVSVHLTMQTKTISIYMMLARVWVEMGGELRMTTMKMGNAS